MADDKAMIRAMQGEIEALKRQLVGFRGGGGGAARALQMCYSASRRPIHAFPSRFGLYLSTFPNQAPSPHLPSAPSPPLPPHQASHGPHVEAKHHSAALSAKEELVKQVCVWGGGAGGIASYPLPLVWL